MLWFYMYVKLSYISQLHFSSWFSLSLVTSWLNLVKIVPCRRVFSSQFLRHLSSVVVSVNCILYTLYTFYTFYTFYMLYTLYTVYCIVCNRRDPGSIPQLDIGLRLVGKRKALKKFLGLPKLCTPWANNTLAKDLNTQYSLHWMNILSSQLQKHLNMHSGEKTLVEKSFKANCFSYTPTLSFLYTVYFVYCILYTLHLMKSLFKPIASPSLGRRRFSRLVAPLNFRLVAPLSLRLVAPGGFRLVAPCKRIEDNLKMHTGEKSLVTGPFKANCFSLPPASSFLQASCSSWLQASCS